ncbi:MAG: hypothetical protein K2W95_11870 [Candidatus Obscuribacterales bacterium]|nr:hypothetical protein [Candidatus Obscuribacterales bacterium]
MSDSHLYVSDYHWQIMLPDEFVLLPITVDPGAIYGSEKRVCFRADSEPQAKLSWELIPHSPFDEETVSRFMSLLDRGNPVDLRVLHRVITPISPVPEAISAAGVIALDSGALAVEVLETPQSGSTTCQFVFPSRHYRLWPVHQMTTVLQAYRDPFEKGVIFARRMNPFHSGTTVWKPLLPGNRIGLSGLSLVRLTKSSAIYCREYVRLFKALVSKRMRALSVLRLRQAVLLCWRSLRGELRLRRNRSNRPSDVEVAKAPGQESRAPGICCRLIAVVVDTDSRGKASKLEKRTSAPLNFLCSDPLSAGQ